MLLKNQLLILVLLMATAVSPASESQGFESIYAINSFYGRKTIIMVGSTGAGKSTLGNLLSGSKMKSYHDREASKNKYQLVDDKHPNLSPIGLELTSQTEIPIAIRLPDSRDQILLDIPGTEQNRGIRHQLISIFTQKLLYKNTNEIKIIVVVDENDLLYNPKFQQVLEWLNIGDKVPKGIVLVVTKVTRDSEQLSQLLRKKSRQLHDNLVNGAAFFEHIIASGRYAAFNQPEGTERDKITLERTKNKIWELLNSVEFMSYFPFGDETRSLSYSMRIKVRQLEPVLKDELSQLVRLFQTKSKDLMVSTSSEQFAAIRSLVNDSVKFWEQLPELGKQLPSLKNLIENDLATFQKLLQFIDDDWSQALELMFKKDLLKALSVWMESIEEAENRGFIKRMTGWLAF